MKKVLIICTGNSCRSQMAEGFLKNHEEFEVYSAGTKPADAVNPNSIAAMKEVGIDISMQKPNHIDDYLSESFDYVITVCDGAKEICPVFTGKVGVRMHIGFEDPWGHNLDKYREVRDLIKEKLDVFAKSAK